MTPFTVEPGFVAEHGRALSDDLEADFEHLGRQLRRRGVEIEALVSRAQSLRVALPSWGVGTGGTRFARFPGPGEPRDVFEKLDDCATVQSLVRVTPEVSLHIPWDRPADARVLKDHAAARGLSFGAMNSNTFQDQESQQHSYKFGSLSHPDAAVREQAVAHNLECIAIGQALGSDSITVWIGDGGNFPGQHHFRRALERYLDSLRAIYRALPEGWRMFLEHKLEEPAFYSTVLNDWGTSYWCSSQLGQFGKLAGFHFNDSKYGDDDLDSGSIKPFQLFLVFNELVDAELARLPGFAPAYMLDQSHNVTDPLESLMTSAVEVVRAYVQAHLVDRDALAGYQDGCDPLMALATLKQAFTTDVAPILAMARRRAGGAVDPVGAYRASGYRARKAQERPAPAGGRGGGIV
jgi:L-rhamnose isomerase / sugar isomerase